MKYHKSFLITLGHNSSVIYFGGDGAKPIGYEEERLSKKKSDSSYPKLAFEKILSQLDREQIQESNIFISHWFDNFDINTFPVKYFDVDHFMKVVNAYKLDVITANSQFTHHEAHAYSTLAFAENFPTKVEGKKHHIVVDGFGNNQEVISIYEQIDYKTTSRLLPIKKVYGFGNSLGLLYQYATSFCGMKENQDEYKFLGYEANIRNVLSEKQIESIQIRAYGWSMSFMKDCLVGNTQKPEIEYEPNIIGIDIDYLLYRKGKFYSEFEDLMRGFGPFNTVDDLRTVIGFYVQAILEQCLLRIIGKYKMKNVYLSGGCFLNVKLNKVILDNITGHICVNPLAGDQGAAIGMFRKYTNSYFNFSDLCFGVRDSFHISEEDKLDLAEENILVFNSDEQFVNGVVSMLQTNANAIVNVFQGNMEFGPRALCNTSTLAKPTIENTQYINMVNNRNEVMPMAPVMLSDSANMLLCKKDLDRVIGSNKFMIITHDFRQSEPRFRGILHSKPLTGDYTCRPQIIDIMSRSNICNILTESDSHCLINTSFNTHGSPILFSLQDALDDFRKQRERDSEDRLVLVILNK